MRFFRIVIGSVLLLVPALPACSDDGPAGLPNPASVYCEEQGGSLQIRTDAEGNQYGICAFGDGSECDEWALYHRDCGPGEVTAGPGGSGGGPSEEPAPDPGPGIADEASEYCVDQGGHLEIRDEAGGEAGYCIGPNGVECPEWAFFHGACTWGDAGE